MPCSCLLSSAPETLHQRFPFELALRPQRIYAEYFWGAIHWKFSSKFLWDFTCCCHGCCQRQHGGCFVECYKKRRAASNRWGSAQFLCVGALFILCICVLCRYYSSVGGRNLYFPPFVECRVYHWKLKEKVWIIFFRFDVVGCSSVYCGKSSSNDQHFHMF